MSGLAQLRRLVVSPRLSISGFSKRDLSCTSVVNNAQKKDVVFFDQEVQTLLKELTGLNYEKIFRIRKMGQDVQKPIYQFMTEEEILEAQNEIRVKAEDKLQMPPVMEERNPSGKVLETDPELMGFDTCKHVFTDITYGVSDRSRIIVVRDPDGTLRTSDWEEQDRLNQTYYPREGRRHYVPPMFEPENLQHLLGPDKYEMILDKNCLQFEPDHPMYIQTAETVYSHVNESKNFDCLHSTRHYGPMLFHLAWSKQLDECIINLIRKDDLADAAKAIALYLIIHPECQMNSVEEVELGVEDMIRHYAKMESLKSSKVTMALERLNETKSASANTKSGILESQGAN